MKHHFQRPVHRSVRSASYNDCIRNSSVKDAHGNSLLNHSTESERIHSPAETFTVAPTPCPQDASSESGSPRLPSQGPPIDSDSLALNHSSLRRVDDGEGSSPLNHTTNDDWIEQSATPGQQRVLVPHQTITEMALENNYRVLPLLIGCIIPVSILINVPSVSSPWVGTAVYNATSNDWDSIKDVPTPRWLDAMIILALVMSVICNICVLFRFLERYTWHAVIMSLVTATIQDFLCIGILIPFCIIFPPGEGYIYLEGFWTMIASMIFSLAATVLISLDLNRTPHFRLSGSGVTQKQRILIAEAMALCLYLAFGALAFVYIERWRPLDALFFVMVTITTIGFGDRVPETPGGRVFAIFYAIGGIVLLALVVNSIRYVILEDLHGELAVRARERKAKRHARRLEQRTREEANRQRLQDTLRQTHRMGSASGVGESTHTFPRYFSLPYGNHLRLPTLFMGDAEARQSEPVDQQGICPDTKSNDDNRMEVIEILNEAPIRELSGSRMHNNDRGGTNILPSECSSADQRNTADSPHGTPRHMASGYYQRQHLGDTRWWSKLAIFKHKPPQTAPYLTPEEQRKADREEAEKETMREYQIRLWSSAMTFLFFWVIGAVIFTFVESWDFGSAMYFGVVAFSTIGYGDLVPKTIAGRAIFLSYCLLGVVTMTSLASLIAEVLSKRMRKHVVRTQLRRVERLEAFEDERNSRLRNNLDIEQAEHQGSGSDNGSQDGHLQALNGPEELDASADSDTCQGSLRRLVKVSKDLDKALQQVLSGLDYTMDDSCRASPLPVATPSAIVDYLEKEEGDSNIYLSPSISRDITSTSSIHRTMRPMLQVHRQRLEGRSSTFHGTNGGMIDDGSKMTIMDWPSRAGTPTPRSGTPTQSSPKPARRQVTLPTLSPQASISPSYPTYQRNRNDNATAPVQWLHLVKYVKQFKALTVACEEALQKVAEWEASEKKLRKRRSQAYRHQTQLLQERLRQLQGHETPDTIDQEHEEEELEDLNWEEEGSNGDEEDEALNQRRSVIVATLLGSENPRRDHGRGRSMSTAMSQSVPAGQDIALAARQQRSQQVDRDSYPPINASRL